MHNQVLIELTSFLSLLVLHMHTSGSTPWRTYALKTIKYMLIKRDKEDDDGEEKI